MDNPPCVFLSPPCTPDCAPWARRVLGGHDGWPGVYRRSATGLAARGAGVVPCQLHGIDRHSATGLMARSKGQRGSETMLAFLHAGLGQCPCTPDCAPWARGYPGDMLVGFGNYRRSAEGLAARGAGAVPCLVKEKGRHSAMGLMARSKGQRGSETMLAFLHAGLGLGQCPCTPDCAPLGAGLVWFSVW